MNCTMSSLLTAPLVQLGCLTLPLQGRLLDDRIPVDDYRQAVLSVARRFPAGRSAKMSLDLCHAMWG